MKYGLGIDTGGTYTDAVIYRFDNNTILASAKSPTTREDLTIGITGALRGLPPDILSNVRMVSLSTTLATNACVEGKGSRATLVMIGCDPELVERYGSKYGLPSVEKMIFLPGGHSQQGVPGTEPDWEALLQAADKHAGITDSFAVVELWGIRNPAYERKAKDLLRQRTSLPVVCAHELTPEVNSLKRAASTLLNAQLIPIISEFLSAVKFSLETMGIHAPLVMVRGDGSLMSEEFAREKPVETLLSGPSASISGGIHLAGEKDCLIVDMGGTTSDLAIVRDGRALLAQEGVHVGKWKTGTRSVLISTIGLGGDSRITWDNDNRIHLGPQRVAPLSWLAATHPQVIGELRGMSLRKKRHTLPLCEFFYLIKDIPNDAYYSKEEKTITRVLIKGPMSLEQLAEAAGLSIYTMRTQRLEQQGIVMKSALTPTDLMHLSGDFTRWNKEAARLGAEITAFQLGIDLPHLIGIVKQKVVETLYFHIAKLLMEQERPGMWEDGMNKQAEELILTGCQTGGLINCRLSSALPLVGIGAPIHLFLPDTAKHLGTRTIIPEHAAVANALGAITGNIHVEETVIIRPQYAVYGIVGYHVFTSADRHEFEHYEEALEWAKQEAEKLAEFTARSRGAGGITVVLNINRQNAELPSSYGGSPEGDKEGSGVLFLETVITAKAIGSIQWQWEEASND